jgi:purine nucleosidase
MAGIGVARDIIIDCDPGIDDAVALMMAFGAPELNVLGVTAVAGNQGIAITAENALRLCAFAGRADVPVYAGCERALSGVTPDAAGIHGESGLGGMRLRPSPAPLRPEHAVDWLVRTLEQRPDARPVTIVAMGPLTNIAVALGRSPRIAASIGEIVVMGGSIAEGGNVTAAAEFNIFADPHAAQAVLACGRPVTLVPLDATHQVVAGPQRIGRIAAMPGPIGAAVAEGLRFYGRGGDAVHGGGALHDPCTIAYLIRPELFAGRPAHVEVELADPARLGATDADWSRPSNCTVLLDADADGFFDLLQSCLERLPAGEPASAPG